MAATKTSMLRVDVSDKFTPALDLPKSPVQRITEKYLNGAKLEFYNPGLPVAFDDAFQNQYIGALHNAFAEHYAFILNPDDIWLLVLQGLSIHINQNAEKYRDILVDFQGKKEIVVEHNGLVKGSPDNTWDFVFPLFQEKITELIKDGSIADRIVPNFSTSTDIDKTCFRVSLMDITKSYFTFVVQTRCGIPTVFIDGVKEDWLTILGSINELLPKFEMGEWAQELSDIICRIITVYDGNIDLPFFEDIYKYKSHSGGDSVTGWINAFFPYIVNGKKIVRKKVSTEGNRFSPAGSLTTSNFPSSICSVPFVWEYYGTKYNMNFYAGFCGFDESQMDSVRPRKNFFIAYEK